jgi:hypothetical protein
VPIPLALASQMASDKDEPFETPMLKLDELKTKYCGRLASAKANTAKR